MTRNNMLLFRVVDTGIGIKEEDQKSLFTMFNRSNEATSRLHNTKGVGLGLTISKRLIEQF